MKAHSALDDSGVRYQAAVPDTFDLDERAALALNVEKSRINLVKKIQKL